jgi:hypothetical protein
MEEQSQRRSIASSSPLSVLSEDESGHASRDEHKGVIRASDSRSRIRVKVTEDGLPKKSVAV